MIVTEEIVGPYTVGLEAAGRRDIQNNSVMQYTVSNMGMRTKKFICQFKSCDKAYSSEHSRRQHYRRFHRDKWVVSKVRRRAPSLKYLPPELVCAVEHVKAERGKDSICTKAALRATLGDDDDEDVKSDAGNMAKLNDKYAEAAAAMRRYSTGSIVPLPAQDKTLRPTISLTQSNAFSNRDASSDGMPNLTAIQSEPTFNMNQYNNAMEFAQAGLTGAASWAHKADGMGFQAVDDFMGVFSSSGDSTSPLIYPHQSPFGTPVISQVSNPYPTSPASLTATPMLSAPENLCPPSNTFPPAYMTQMSNASTGNGGIYNAVPDVQVFPHGPLRHLDSANIIVSPVMSDATLTAMRRYSMPGPLVSQADKRLHAFTTQHSMPGTVFAVDHMNGHSGATAPATSMDLSLAESVARSNMNAYASGLVSPVESPVIHDVKFTANPACSPNSRPPYFSDSMDMLIRSLAGDAAYAQSVVSAASSGSQQQSPAILDETPTIHEETALQLQQDQPSSLRLTAQLNDEQECSGALRALYLNDMIDVTIPANCISTPMFDLSFKRSLNMDERLLESACGDNALNYLTSSGQM